MLRQFYLTSLAYQGLEQRRPPIKGGSWVEHPSDPSTSSMSPSAWRCSSIWNTQAYKVWAKHLKHRQVLFDECMLGQVSAKPTTISTDLELAHWHQMFCQHDRHRVDPSLKSSDLSRYPRDMMRGLAQAISNHCTPLLSQHTQQVTGVGIPLRATAQAASPKTTSGHTPQLENHAKRPWQDHAGGTVEGSPKTSPKKQRPEIKMSPEKSRSIAGAAAIATLRAGAKGENTSPDEPTAAHLEASDRPTVVPRAGVGPAWPSSPVESGVQDETCPGRRRQTQRLPPSRRPRSFFLELWEQRSWHSPRIGSNPWKLSLSCGKKQHPFPESLLSQVREVLGSSPEEIPPSGQPLYLQLLCSLATKSGDPDHDFPTMLANGVTLTSPGVWPLKSELSGEHPAPEDLATPTGRANYSSAKDFASHIRKMFVEEEAMDMVIGPLTTTQAAEHCHCSEEDLCPGPLAAIDEGGKIRTIYDGSFGGANKRIQNNTTERTTAPTGCMKQAALLHLPLVPLAQ